MEKDRLDRIENKIDDLNDKVGSIDVTLAVNTEQLKIHIHRTDLLEKAIVPLQKKEQMVEGVLKFVGIVSLVLGVVYTAIRVLKSL
jgi:hypothetical protein